MKKILKSVIFIFVFCLLWNYLFNILWLPKNNISYFYDEQNNSLDVIYIGGSNVDQYFNPLLSYELYGFTTGFLSTSSQPFIATQFLIEESKKTQNPELYIIDLTRSQDNFVTDFTEVRTREVTDSMEFSVNRINTINKILKYAEISGKEYINYYFSFFKYHNSWKYGDNNRIYNNKNTYKGYTFYQGTTKKNPQKEYTWNNKIYKLYPENEQVLLDLIDYIKSNKLNVLFVIPKMSCFWTPNQQQLNGAVEIIKNNNLNVINFNILDVIEFDYNTDFYNKFHLNVYGSTKYTLYFAKYLKENYNLKNHKLDENYKSWNDAYERFKNDFEFLTNQNFENIVSEYRKYHN